jgi:arginine/serine-rich splicing factor 12
MDQTRAEEIRRTVYVSNLDPRVTFEHLHELFTQIGEVKYIRMTVSEKGVQYDKLGLGVKQSDEEEIDYESDSVGAYIEFSEQPSVLKALCLNGLMFAQRNIRINHTVQGVIVPPTADEQVLLDDLRKSSKRDEKESRKKDEKKESSRSSHKHRHSKR